MALIFKTSNPRIRELTQSIKDYTLLGISDKGEPTEFLISALLSYVPDLTEAMTKFISDDNLAELEGSNSLAEDVAPSQKSVVEYVKTTGGIANAISGCPGGYIGKSSEGTDAVNISDPGNPSSYEKGTMDKSFFDTMRTGLAYIHTVSSNTDSENPRLTWGGFGSYTNQREIHVSDLVKVSVNVSGYGMGYLWLLVQYINFEPAEYNRWRIDMWEVSGQVVDSSLDGARGGLASALDINVVPIGPDPDDIRFFKGLSIGYNDPDDQSASWRYDDIENDFYLDQFNQISTKVPDDSQCTIELFTEEPSKYLPFELSELNSTTLLFTVNVLNPDTNVSIKGYIYYKPIEVYKTIRIGPRPRPGSTAPRIAQYHIVLEPLLSLLNGLPGTLTSVKYLGEARDPEDVIGEITYDEFMYYVSDVRLNWGEYPVPLSTGDTVCMYFKVKGYGECQAFYEVTSTGDHEGESYIEFLTNGALFYLMGGKDGSLGDVILDTDASGAISNSNNSWTTYLNSDDPISKDDFDSFALENQPHYIFSNTLSWSDDEESILVDSVLRIKLLVKHHGYGYLFYKVNTIEDYQNDSFRKRLTCSCILGLLDGFDGTSDVTEYSPGLINSRDDDIEGATDLSYPITPEAFKGYATDSFMVWISDLAVGDEVKLKIPVIGYKDCYIYGTVHDSFSSHASISPTSYEYSSLDDITGELGISTLIKRDDDAYLQVGINSSEYDQYFRVPLTYDLSVSQFKTFRSPKSGEDDYRLLRIDKFSRKGYGSPSDLLNKELLVLVIVDDDGTKYNGYLFYEVSAVNPIAGEVDSYLIYLSCYWIHC